MALNTFKVLFLVLSVFALSICAVSAEVDVLSASVEPSSATTSDALSCKFTVSGDESTYNVAVTWTVDGAAHTTDDETITAANNMPLKTSSIGDIEAADTTKGQAWRCIVTATDSSDNSDSETSSAVTIANTAPAFSSTASTSATIGDQYSYDANANDADDDTLTYSLQVYPTGMAINPASGMITWTPSDTQTGTHSVTVRVSDSTTYTDQSFDISISNIRLVITDISASCDPESCEDNGLDENDAMNGDAGTITEVAPGSTVTLKARVKNTWPEDTDNHNIDSIELTCTLEDIEDEDEQEESIDFDDLDPSDRSDKEEMQFYIPDDAEEDTYTIECTLEGEDEDGTDYSIDFDVDVDVEKDKHSVVFTKSTLTPSTASCTRDVTLDIGVQNIGSSDEDDVELVLDGSELDIDDSILIGTLEEGDSGDKDTKYSKQYKFTVGKKVAPGTYNIHLEVFFDDGDDSNIKDVTLTVADCQTSTGTGSTTTTGTGSTTTGTGSTSTGKPTTSEQVEVVQQPYVPAQQATQTTTQAQQGTKSITLDTYTIVLVIAVIVVLAAFGIMLGLLLRKK
jgi:hypothetical protein